MKKILIVDDDVNLVESAKDILEDAGYQVFTASTLATARLLWTESVMDILLVDFNLPDGKGPELAQAIKSQWPAIKTVLMSGESFSTMNPQSAMFDHVLSKPVEPTKLLAVLAAFDS